MPTLKSSQIPVGPFQRARLVEVRPDETRLTCPEPGCQWTTVRPTKYAWSAAEGHRIWHSKQVRR